MTTEPLTGQPAAPPDPPVVLDAPAIPDPGPYERLRAEVDAEQATEPEAEVTPRERRRRALAVKVPLCGPDDDGGAQAYVEMIPPTKWGPITWDALRTADWYSWAEQVLIGDGDLDTFDRLQPDPEECNAAVEAAAAAVGGSLGGSAASNRFSRRSAKR
jgi:hypothetical protein